MKRSAGILVYRKTSGDRIEVLLVHPGGPFWSKKDTWSLPKGEVEENEELLAAAKREFDEETGLALPEEGFIELGSCKQSSAKVNFIWALEGNPELSTFVCRSTFILEWPLKSGQTQNFPENDKIAWFTLASAKLKIFKGQQVFLDRLAEQLHVELASAPEQQALL